MSTATEPTEVKEASCETALRVFLKGRGDKKASPTDVDHMLGFNAPENAKARGQVE